MLLKKVYLSLVAVLMLSFSVDTLYSQVNNQPDYNLEIRRVFSILRTTNNDALRLKTVKSLRLLKTKKVLAPLIFALNDRSSFVRIAAIRIIRTLNYLETINPLIRRLRVEKELFVQKELILTLGIMKAQKARWIIRTFLQEKSSTLREAAKMALAIIAQP